MPILRVPAEEGLLEDKYLQIVVILFVEEAPPRIGDLSLPALKRGIVSHKVHKTPTLAVQDTALNLIVAMADVLVKGI